MIVQLLTPSIIFLIFYFGETAEKDGCEFLPRQYFSFWVCVLHREGKINAIFSHLIFFNTFQDFSNHFFKFLLHQVPPNNHGVDPIVFIGEKGLFYFEPLLSVATRTL